MFRRLLLPLSVLYGFFAALNRYLYMLGIRKSYRLPRPVISVGNLSVGGTGKTPVVIAISKYLQSVGKKPVVLSRGYKRRYKDTFICNESFSFEECGDEPVLISRYGIDVVVGKDRFYSAKLAVDKLKPDIFILDDGFQHHPVKKDINILLVDATKPFWDDNLLPVGNLREPKTFYRYADCFIITRLERLKNKELFLKKISEFKKPYYIAKEMFGNLYNINKDVKRFEELKGKDVIVMSAIGDNRQFFDKMAEFADIYKFNIKKSVKFIDHYDYSNFKPDSNITYITTEKDIVKIKKENVYAVEYRFQIEEGFYKFMMEKLDG